MLVINSTIVSVITGQKHFTERFQFIMFFDVINVILFHGPPESTPWPPCDPWPQVWKPPGLRLIKPIYYNLYPRQIVSWWGCVEKFNSNNSAVVGSIPEALSVLCGKLFNYFFTSRSNSALPLFTHIVHSFVVACDPIWIEGNWPKRNLIGVFWLNNCTRDAK